ncbi:hypothetical protein CEE36_08245 [candidate division TA06 bacterium B3_TA06]|uniref:Uncharacterized protein n=1 Tax=candidate division TA06 bacterium B3_TA06 TaxID=2012487 RepID=A0A532V2L9_UNCT6|nr:MAG: hypothetical protein CEE36_08245 [candidate division TA06 bacterium B3_TA06]
MTKKKKEPKTTEELLEEISSKLNCVIYLLGADIFQEGTQKNHVKKLKKVGFNYKEIALMLGTTPGSISVATAPSQSKKKPKK